MYIHVKYPLFLPHFNQPCIFLTDFGKILKLRYIEIAPVTAKLLHAETQTEGHDEIVAFRNFENAPKRTSMRCVKIGIPQHISKYFRTSGKSS
jgi:hypothetical protein